MLDKMVKRIDSKQIQEGNINNLLTKDYSYILPPESIAKYPLKKRDQSALLIYRNNNLKKWKTGSLSTKFFYKNKELILTADKIKTNQDYTEILFRWNDNNISFGEVLDNIGLTPIPPYLKRDPEDSDKERYQTIYSRTNGSVAAPTSGLHFTDNVLEKLNANNIKHTEITLHIGAGTFVPIKSDNVKDHKMHSEHFYISESSVNQLINSKDNLIAIGTTSVRAIESVYWLGVKMIDDNIINQNDLFIKQWETYELRQDIPLTDSLIAILKYMKHNKLDRLGAITRMMIVPGYKFRLIKGLVTNFHLPCSSLLLLIASFIGDDWRKVYDFALNNNFRFLSYGDSSLLYRE